MRFVQTASWILDIKIGHTRYGTTITKSDPEFNTEMDLHHWSQIQNTKQAHMENLWIALFGESDFNKV